MHLARIFPHPSFEVGLHGFDVVGAALEGGDIGGGIVLVNADEEGVSVITHSFLCQNI